MSEYARRKTDNRNTGIVSISRMIEENEDPRKYRYNCIDERCDVPVFPAIPDKVKPGRRRSPSPYFRAGRSEQHQKDCRRGVIEESIRHSGREGRHPNPAIGEERARVGEVPVRFVESFSVRNVGGTDNPQIDTSRGTSGSRGQSRRGKGTGTSQATTNSVERFANAYENPPAPHNQMPIAIREYPARTFSETFLSPIEGVRKGYDEGDRHIFRGSYDRYESWKTGVSVYFQETVNDQLLSIWIPNNLQPTSVLNRLLDRLQEAERVSEAVIYVLGRFVHKPNHGKYAIELWSPYQFWIHIPNP